MWQDYLSVGEDLDARMAVRMKVAVSLDEQLADTDAAFAAYGEALREDPAHEAALNGLETLAKRLEYWQVYVDLLEDIVENIPSEWVARDLLLRVARVYDEELQQPEEAILRFRRALEFDPDHEGSILALDRLYQSISAWNELSEILLLRIERSEPEDRVDLLVRLGGVYEIELEDPSQALIAYRSSRHSDGAS